MIHKNIRTVNPIPRYFSRPNVLSNHVKTPFVFVFLKIAVISDICFTEHKVLIILPSTRSEFYIPPLRPKKYRVFLFFQAERDGRLTLTKHISHDGLMEQNRLVDDKNFIRVKCSFCLVSNSVLEFSP